MKKIIYSLCITLGVMSCNSSDLTESYPPLLESLKLNYSEVEMNIGDTIHLKVLTQPANNIQFAEYSAWASDDYNSIVSLDGDYGNDGYIITALSTGETRVSVNGYYGGNYVSDGYFDLTCDITVKFDNIFKVKNITATSAELKCSKGDLAAFEYMDVQLYKNGYDYHKFDSFSVDRYSTSFELTGLAPSTEYKAEIYLYDSSYNCTETYVEFTTDSFDAFMSLSVSDITSYYSTVNVYISVDSSNQDDVVYTGYELSSYSDFWSVDQSDYAYYYTDSYYYYFDTTYFYYNDNYYVYGRPYAQLISGDKVYGNIYCINTYTGSVTEYN